MMMSKLNIINSVPVCTLFVCMRLGANIECRGLIVRVRVRIRVRIYFGCDVSIVCMHVE